MRVLLVSAHHPPNFVSGGALQPQRLASGLAARGHEVSVFAGWLGRDREPLATWEAPDDVGLPTRWVATQAFIGWDGVPNYDNPAVTALFVEHLARIRPDVVHLHSLQGLGAGLVAAARDAGAKVVVTMHDFWWVCSRQFLVDRELRACCPVVDAGACPCEGPPSWLAARRARLAELLAAADVALVPSASARALLVANGFDPDRLEVDENGLERVPPPAPRRADGTVRFLYTGGEAELKGIGVLYDAAQRLRAVPGWSVTAIGAGPWAGTVGLPLDDVPVVDRQPFRGPAESDEVFAGSDVLVVPSIMRESHSIVTREGLLRGLPVICTDSFGPEEVVVDGVNGFVVPAGDSEALAAAMRRFVDDPQLLERLRPSASAVVVRSLADQVAGLERRYEALLAGPSRSPASEHRPEVGPVLFIVGIDGAPLRYRAHLPAEGLGSLGVAAEVRHFLDPDLPRAVDAAATVIVYRVPANSFTDAVVDRARDRGVPVWFDADDLIVDPGVADQIPALDILDQASAQLWLDGVHRYRTMLERCDGYLASTAPLARHVGALTGHPTRVFENGVGLVLGRRSDQELRRGRRPGPPRLGYFSGTDTHDHDWAMIEPVVAELLAERAPLELWIGGPVTTGPALARHGSRVRRLPTVPWLEVPGLLRDVDVNLAPLAPGSVFNEGKSAIKWLEAALVATPTVASPTEPFRAAVDDGRTGLLADDAAGWASALRRLLDDPIERRTVGGWARRDALLRWGPHEQARRYLALLEEIHLDRPARTAPAVRWSPVTVTEDPRRVPLDPYDGNGTSPRRSGEWVARVRSTASRLRAGRAGGR